MKNVYVRPEVEYINFYSEETITSDWDYNANEDVNFGGNPENNPTLSLVNKGEWI